MLASEARELLPKVEPNMLLESIYKVIRQHAMKGRRSVHARDIMVTDMIAIRPMMELYQKQINTAKGTPDDKNPNVVIMQMTIGQLVADGYDVTNQVVDGNWIFIISW